MKKIIKWILIVGGVLILIGFIGAMMDDGAGTTTNAVDTNAATANPQEQAVTVSAQELFNAYENNEVGADQTYKGKPLLISGTVSAIASDFADDAQVQLTTSNEFMSVMASGDDNFNSMAASLNKGQQITMLCQGAGEVIGSPMVDECVIQ